MNRFKLKSQFKNIKTKARSQLDHIWTNAPETDCKLVAKFSQIDLYGIQTTKHTSNL
jgi:hypothetical protein